MVIRIAAGETTPETAGRDKPRRDRVRAEQNPFLDVVSALMRRAPVIALGVVLPILLAWAYLKVNPPKFTAVAGVFADPAAGRVGGATVPPTEGYIPLATSRPVLDRAVEREGLATDPAIFVGPAPMAQRFLELVERIRGQPPTGQDRRAAVLQHLSTYANVSASREANVIDIAVSATDAATAARLANAMAEAFVDEASAALDRRAASGAARQPRRGDELRARVREAEAALQRYRAENATDVPVDPTAALARARALILENKTKYERIQQALANGKDTLAIADALRSPAIDRLKIQVNEAASQEASMRSTLGPRHPSYLEAVANVQEKKKLLTEAVRLAAAAAKADLQAATAQAQALESGTVLPAYASGSVDAGRLAELERAVQNARNGLDQHTRSAEGATETAVARIVRAATKPEGAPSPQPAVIWSVAALTSLILAAILAWPVFSPASGTRRRRTARDSAYATAPAVRAGPGHLDAVGNDCPRAPRTAASPSAPETRVERRGKPGSKQNPGAEQIGALVQELSDKAWSVALQTTLVVAAEGADGAAAALEIAIGAAAKNLRVLLLDADERSPALSRVLSDVPLSAYVMIHGRKKAIGAFESMPGHPIWIAPAESLSYARRENLRAPLILPALTGHFDLLIITGPEVGAMAAGEDMLAAASERIAVVRVGRDADPAEMAALLRVPASKVRIISGALPMIERRRENLAEASPQGASLFRFQED